MADTEATLGKVTAFVTRPGPHGPELLLLEHPYAGIQIPAGTVEESETPERAVLREVREETGLQNVRIVAYIGHRDEAPPGATHVIAQTTRVYARPDRSSFHWAELRRGIRVTAERREGAFTQVTYEEWDRFPNPTYVTYRITGWVPSQALCATMRRHFFHLALEGEAPREWAHDADSHTFRLFWAPLGSLPPVVEPQSEWVPYVRDELGYGFGGG